MIIAIRELFSFICAFFSNRFYFWNMLVTSWGNLDLLIQVSSWRLMKINTYNFKWRVGIPYLLDSGES